MDVIEVGFWVCVDNEDVEFFFIFYGVYYGMRIVCVVEWERGVFV